MEAYHSCAEDQSVFNYFERQEEYGLPKLPCWMCGRRYILSSLWGRFESLVKKPGSGAIISPYSSAQSAIATPGSGRGRPGGRCWPGISAPWFAGSPGPAQASVKEIAAGALAQSRSRTADARGEEAYEAAIGLRDSRDCGLYEPGDSSRRLVFARSE
jgi:hypothetical protein